MLLEEEDEKRGIASRLLSRSLFSILRRKEPRCPSAKPRLRPPKDSKTQTTTTIDSDGDDFTNVFSFNKRNADGHILLLIVEFSFSSRENTNTNGKIPSVMCVRCCFVLSRVIRIGILLYTTVSGACRTLLSLNCVRRAWETFSLFSFVVSNKKSSRPSIRREFF